MRTAIVDALTAQKAKQQCLALHGWYPDAVRRVDSGGKNRAYMCFESAQDAEAWDKQS